MKIFTLIIIITISTVQLIAQNGLDMETKIKIRKGFESLDDLKDPAIVSITFPANKENTYLVNGGVSYSFSKTKHKDDNNSSKFSIEPFFVINRNTQLKKEQNNFKIGLTSNWKLGKLDNAQRKLKYLNWTNTSEYIYDKLDTSNSIAVTSYFSFINSSAKKNSFFINTYKSFMNDSIASLKSKKNIFRGIQYYFTPIGGIEYQQKFQANSENRRGSIGRGYFNIGFKIAKKIDPFRVDSRLGKQLFELGFSYTGRYDIINSTGAKEGYLSLLKAEFNLFPTLSSNLSIGLSYNKGADPLAGLADQEYYLLALRFKK